MPGCELPLADATETGPAKIATRHAEFATRGIQSEVHGHTIANGVRSPFDGLSVTIVVRDAPFRLRVTGTK